MKKILRNEKGFTLVELMIVIAIIGILASVLVPKMGFMKDNAKGAGIDSNMRIVEATISSMIIKYNSTQADTFAADLVTTLNDVTKNPFSSSSVARAWDTSNPAAAIYTYAGQYSAYNATTGSYPYAAGSVICAYYTNQGRLKVDLFSIDKAGTKSTTFKTVE